MVRVAQVAGRAVALEGARLVGANGALAARAAAVGWLAAGAGHDAGLALVDVGALEGPAFGHQVARLAHANRLVARVELAACVGPANGALASADAPSQTAAAAAAAGQQQVAGEQQRHDLDVVVVTYCLPPLGGHRLYVLSLRLALPVVRRVGVLYHKMVHVCCRLVGSSSCRLAACCVGHRSHHRGHCFNSTHLATRASLHFFAAFIDHLLLLLYR